MRPRTKRLVANVAWWIVVIALLIGMDTLSYRRGIRDAMTARDAAENRLRISMMSLRVCEWTQIYREKMGCMGAPPTGTPVPHIPDKLEDGE